MNAGIERLRELTEKLPSLSAMVSNRNNHVVEYDSAGGKSTGWELDYSHLGALQKNIMTAGCTFLEHTHEGKEVLIILEGEGKYVVEGKEHNYCPRDVIIFGPGCPHQFHAQTTTVMWAGTMPPCEGYPGGER